MNMNLRLRNYILENKMTFSYVAERSGVGIKKFSRWMTNSQRMSTDDYEKICIHGLGVDPGYFYSKKFLETKKSPNSA